MLSGRHRRSQRATATSLVAAALVLIGASSAASYDNGRDNPPPSGPPPAAEASAQDGTLTVTVSIDGVTNSGTRFTDTTRHNVAPRCWYGRGMTGPDYYEYWKPGGVARQSGTLDDFAYQDLLNPGYEDYADVDGYWYEADCRLDVPVEEVLAYRASHPPVYVPTGDPAPPTEQTVAPEVLAEIAYQAMELPTGTIRWNPSLPAGGATVVGLDTWVWVEDAPVTVSLTASIPSGTAATVQAHLSAMKVSARGADTITCPDEGTPWTATASDTGCSLVFTRSTAGLDVPPGQTLPTTTMTVDSVWSASWTSTLDPTPTALPDQTITSTAEIAVAEIQQIVAG